MDIDGGMVLPGEATGVLDGGYGDMRSRVYIAGPMTGVPDFNYPAFHQADKELRQQGWTVHNPATHFDGRQDLSRATYLRKACEEVLKVHAIALLPGWNHSKGARLEVAIGQEIGLPFLVKNTFGEWAYLTDGPSTVGTVILKEEKKVGFRATSENVMEEAARLVYGDRQQDYGHPYEDFNRTAGLWNAMFGHKLLAPLTAEDVALAMICVKLSRQINRAKRDNLVDVCGYAGTLELVRQRMAEIGDG